MTRQINLGEYSTWRLPVDTVDGLSDYLSPNSRDGDCRLVKGTGIYEYNKSSDSWKPILEVGDLFNLTTTVNLRPGESAVISHDADSTYSRIVQASISITEDSESTIYNSLWRGYDVKLISTSSGRSSVTTELGPDGDVDQVKLSRSSSEDPFDVWSGSTMGLRAILGEDLNERVLIDFVEDGNTAWLSYGHLAQTSALTKSEVDTITWTNRVYDITPIEVYNDIRLIESIKWNTPLEITDASASTTKHVVRTLYSKNQEYVFVIYLSTNSASIVYYDTKTNSYNGPYDLASNVEEIDACIFSAPQAEDDEIRFAYIVDDNVFYNTWTISTRTIGTAEDLVIGGVGGGVDQVRIAQEGNLEPIVFFREKANNTINYRAKKSSSGWESGSYSEYSQVIGYDVDAAPGFLIVYIDASAEGNNNGTSWEDAFTSLSEALNSVVGYAELWVAAGEYYPSSDATGSFILREGLQVYGGFTGSETSLTDRDPIENQTILNGRNINYHVVVGSDNSVIDGFIIKNGNASINGENGKGGGLYNYEASPIVRNCSFQNNNGIGGAIYNYKATDVCIEECSFYSNKSTRGNGGAIYNGEDSSITITNSIFIANTARSGGAIYHGPFGTNLDIRHTTLYGNMATSSGGDAIRCDGPSGRLINSIVWGDEAASDSPLLVNGGTLNVSYSDVVGGVSGGATDVSNNISLDPQFINPNQPAGPDDSFATKDDGLRLQIGSPCLNAGLSSLPIEYDILGEIRDPLDGLDLGAYEGGISNAAVIYVDVNATGSNNGSTWEDAYQSLHLALVSSTPGDELWVAAGTYTPIDIETSLTLLSDMFIYGGFNGTESARDERDPIANETIISGKIGLNRCSVPLLVGSTDSYLDGFTIRDSHGGGMRINTTMTLKNCKFRDNSTNNSGAGVVVLSPGAPTFLNCDFIQNYTNGGYGGAIYFYSDTIIDIQNCIFYKNMASEYASSKGGAIYSASDNGLIKNSVFINNSSGPKGGGAIAVNSTDDNNLEILCCTLFHNLSEREVEEFEVVVQPAELDPETGTVITPEETETQYSYYEEARSIYKEKGNLSITNTILWTHSQPSISRYTEIEVSDAAIQVNNSCIVSNSSGLWDSLINGPSGGAGNISRDPKFQTTNYNLIINQPEGEDELFRTDDDALKLRADSPCGAMAPVLSCPTTDVRGALRAPNSETSVDIGAYTILSIYPPIKVSVTFGMISESKFGLIIAKSDNKLVYRQFTWDGEIYIDEKTIDLYSPSDSVLVDSQNKFALSYWCDGQSYKPIFFAIDKTLNKVKQGSISDDIVSWISNVVTEGTSSIKTSTSMDHRRVSVTRESNTSGGRYLYHHNNHGYDSKNELGSFLLSPPFTTTRKTVGAIDCAEPTSHNPDGPTVISYIDESSSSLEIMPNVDFYNYDNWTVIGPEESDTTSDKPSPRSTPLVSHPLSNSLWIYGGRGVSSKSYPPSFSSSVEPLSDLWKFDLTSEVWTRISTSEQIGERSDHGLLFLSNYLYIIGGYSTIGTELNLDLYRINWNNGTTTKIGTLSKGFAESGLSSHEDELYIFGGVNQSSSSLVRSNKIYKIDPTNETNGLIAVTELVANDSGRVLNSCNGYGACKGKNSNGNTVFYVYGGNDGTQVRNELYMITPTNENSRYDLEILTTEGPQVQKASILYYESRDDRYLFVIGGQLNETDSDPIYSNGVYVYNIDTEIWTNITPSAGCGPISLAGAGLVKGVEEDLFYLFGGFDGSARSVSSTLLRYDIPISKEGELPSNSGNITKVKGSTWIEAINTASMKTIETVKIPGDGYSSPLGTEIRVAVGFGVSGTPYIRRNGSWQAIAESDIHIMGMTIEELNNITSAYWNEQFRPGVHEAIYFLVGLSSDGNQVTPSLSKFEVTYTTPGSYEVVGPTTVKISLSGVSQTTVTNVSNDSQTKEIRVAITAQRS